MNRVIHKPYTENKDDTSGRPDEVMSSLLAAYPIVSDFRNKLYFLCFMYHQKM